MGRKGVSKRKSKQTKTNPVISGTAMPTKERVTDAQPTRAVDVGNVISTHKSVDTPTVDGKKRIKKG